MKRKCVIDQFVDDVTDYSSQYGSTGSISYVATNLCGGPNLYPDYGDFSGSYSLQTYGMWWKSCPSASPCIPDPHPFLKPSMDFVDIHYETPVQPIRIDIYEIYNPGSIIRIWGSLDGVQWSLLYSGTASLQIPQSRIFSPPISQTNKFINLLRIEFNQGFHEYHCGFEAVLLNGSTYVQDTIHNGSLKSIVDEVTIPMQQFEFNEENIIRGAEFLISEELKSFQLVDGKGSDSESSSDSEEEICHKEEEPFDIALWNVEESQNAVEGGSFSLLPEELIAHILKMVDMRCLCRLACTCKALNKFASCSLFYRNLNFKNCWWLISDETFLWLNQQKCIQLRGLDLSWCGGYEKVSSQTFMEFINQCGHNLHSLHLNNCHFIDNYCLYIIANTCSKLEALSLSACRKLDHLGFGELKKLTKLTFLNLSRTRIEFGTLHVLLQSVNQLQHLKIHHCDFLDLDIVSQTLKTFNRSLVSLGAWKTHGLTSRGLKALSSIQTLQELDVGWAFDRFSGVITDGLSELVKKCPNMKKLFLTAYRGLTDEDVDLVAAYGTCLEQVDMMGSRHISHPAVSRLLERCTKLRLLDVSYCEQIHSRYIQHWNMQYPLIAIKGGQKNDVSLS